MAVPAHDIAFRDLGDDCLPLPVRQLVGDAERLVAQVVELEYDRIRFPAIDTRVFAEVRDEQFGSLRVTPRVALSRQLDVLLPVLEVVEPTVLGLAGPAVVVSLPLVTPAPRKPIQSLLDSASATPAHDSTVRADPDVRSYVRSTRAEHAHV
jgi:hypothetical protein